MTRPEAIRIMLMEARYFKMLNLTPKDLVQALESEQYKLMDFDTVEAYDVVKDDMEHIIHWVWYPIKHY
jgi:hypothetical protein